ncbi:MAG: hypothetical protein ACTSUE_18735 [Promethearchaeota archaeon]
MSGRTREFSYYQNQIKNQLIHYHVREHYIGNDAWQLRGVLKLNYPVGQETIEDWTAIERIIHHCIYTLLEVDPSKRMLILCPPYNTDSTMQAGAYTHLEKCAEILFETFDVPRLVIMNPTLAVAEASGIEDALILYLGDDITRITPVITNQTIPSAVFSSEFGKRDLVMYMQWLLKQKGHVFQTSAEKKIVRDMVEEHARFAPSLYDNSIRTSPSIQYPLPNGNFINLTGEQIQAGELFFHPELIVRDEDSIPTIIKKCYEKLSKHERGDDYEGIDETIFEKFSRVLIYGPAAFEGIKMRLENELEKIMAEKPIFKIADKHHLEFIGASMLGKNISKIADQIITKEEYEAVGPTITRGKYKF